MFIPRKSTIKKTGDKSWFDDKCRSAARRKRRLYPKLKKCNTSANKARFNHARQAYNQAEKQAKRNYNIRLRKYLTGNILSSKKCWSGVNSLAGRKGHSDITVIEHNGSARDKANVFCQTFAKNVGFMMLMMSHQ